MDLFNRKKIEELEDKIEQIIEEKDKKIDKNIADLKHKDFLIKKYQADIKELEVDFIKKEAEQLKQKNIEISGKDKIISKCDIQIKNYIVNIKKLNGKLGGTIRSNNKLKKDIDSSANMITELNAEITRLKSKKPVPTMKELEEYQLFRKVNRKSEVTDYVESN